MLAKAQIPLVIQSGNVWSGKESLASISEAACLTVGVDPEDSGWAIHRVVPVIATRFGGHAPFCTCCVARSPLIMSLNQLVIDRARGACPYFSFVVICCADRYKSEIEKLLVEDMLIKSRFDLQKTVSFKSD